MLDADHPHRDKGGFLSRSKALRLFLQEKKLCTITLAGGDTKPMLTCQRSNMSEG